MKKILIIDARYSSVVTLAMLDEAQVVLVERVVLGGGSKYEVIKNGYGDTGRMVSPGVLGEFLDACGVRESVT